ncbi:MAG: flagellar biosynthetic protein FliR [Ruminococcus sp.]|jgi:flagellar biosynthetic protein FliR|nr:flagellar biosynthetic protein FliR [Ruminococcus sp.]
MSIIFTNLTAYTLVFTRLAGVLAFNPILNGRAVPARFRVFVVFMLTLVMAPTLSYGLTLELGSLEYFMSLIRELFIGILMSFVCSAFYYCLLAAGEILDVQFGFGMAKVFDPATNIQMGISDKLLNVFFMLYFFVTDSHLIMFNMLFSSYDLVPLGIGDGFSLARIASFGTEVFVDTFMLAVNLAVPFVVAEFIVEVGLGILMKLIPAIHIFVINMQIKIGVGLILLFILAPAICNFLNNYVMRMLETVQKSLEMFM